MKPTKDFVDEARECCNNVYHDDDAKDGVCNFCRGFSLALQSAYDNGREEGLGEALEAATGLFRSDTIEGTSTRETISEAIKSLTEKK